MDICRRRLTDAVHLARYPRGPEIVEALREGSPKFAELWEEHAVRRFEASRKRFRHPSVGRQQLVVFLPADEATAAQLTALR